MGWENRTLKSHLAWLQASDPDMNEHDVLWDLQSLPPASREIAIIVCPFLPFPFPSSFFIESSQSRTRAPFSSLHALSRATRRRRRHGHSVRQSFSHSNSEQTVSVSVFRYFWPFQTTGKLTKTPKITENQMISSVSVNFFSRSLLTVTRLNLRYQIDNAAKSPLGDLARLAWVFFSPRFEVWFQACLIEREREREREREKER